MTDRKPSAEPTSPLLVTVRYVLPIAVVVVGLAIFIADPHVGNFEGSAALIGAGLSILLLNVLHRTGVRGDVDRAAEDDARRYFDAHGYWPDEAPQPQPQADAAPVEEQRAAARP